MTITETSISGDSATVLIAGPMAFSFDAERLRDVLRKIVQQQGISVDEERMDIVIRALQRSSQSVQVSRTVDVVRESGSWKLCSRLTLTR